MSEFYQQLADEATVLLKEYGTPLTIRRQNAPVLDALSGDSVHSGFLSYIAHCVVLPASGGTVQAFDNRFYGEDLIVDKMRFVIAEVSQATFEPIGGDELIYDGKTWVLMGCTPLKPTDTALIYQFGVKLR